MPQTIHDYLCMSEETESPITPEEMPAEESPFPALEEMAALLRKFVDEGLAVLLVEHDMSFVRRLGSRTIVMHQGRLIADGSFESVSQVERVRDAYLGRA